MPTADPDRRRAQDRERARAYRERRRQQQGEGDRPPRVCLHCGQLLEPGRYLYSDPRRYCSTTCRWAAASRRRAATAVFDVTPPHLSGRPVRVTLRDGVVAVDQATPEGQAVIRKLQRSLLIGAFGHSFDLEHCPFASDIYDCLINAFGVDAVTVRKGWPQIQKEYRQQPPTGAVT